KYQQGIDAFLSVYGANVGGRDVEMVYRDMAGGDPAKARQLAEELIVRDRVSLIGGFFLSPESIAAGPVLTEANVPGVVFNGSALAITETSPLVLRSTAIMAQVV